MASSFTCAAILLLAQHLRASPVHHQTTRPCVEFLLPIEATAQSAIYDVPQVNNDVEAMNFAVLRDTWDHQFEMVKNHTISGTQDISVQLCIPPNGSKKDHLQVATHGVAFDKRYWDAPINPSEYSYVENAMNAGYSILTYDRLGTGNSSKPDAYNTVSATLELEHLRIISEMAKSGELIKKVPSSDIDTSQSFSKVIHVGHSFGSILSLSLLATYPDASDGAVITGMIINNESTQLKLTTFGPEYPRTNDPQLYADFGSGYFIQNSRVTLQSGFFSTRENKTTGVGGFTPEALEYGFSVRQPSAVSDWTTPALLKIYPALEFAGPVQFVNAEFDYVVCGGDCKGTYDEDMIKMLYPKAMDVDFYVQEGTGHGLTLHKRADVGYKVSLDWLAKNGL
jgi:pimeloyl-ACP methyl ester carboxylesterase